MRDTPCFDALGDCVLQVVFLIASIFVMIEASEELDADEDLDAKYMVPPSTPLVPSTTDTQPVAAQLIFASIGVVADVLSFLIMSWATDSFDVVHIHSHGSNGHSHSQALSKTDADSDTAEDAQPTNMNLMAALLHLLVDFGRSATVLVIAIIIYSDVSNSTASRIDAITAMSMCAIGVILTFWLLFGLWRTRHAQTCGDL